VQINLVSIFTKSTNVTKLAKDVQPSNTICGNTVTSVKWNMPGQCH